MKHTTDDSLLRIVAKSIRKARHHAELKQTVAARMLGISTHTLSGYENERAKDITITDLLNMSQLYNCPVTSFFDSAADSPN